MIIRMLLSTSVAMTALMVGNAARAQSTSAAVPEAMGPASSSDEDIIITGIRAGLKSSLDVKRKSDQIVDAVSAEDVGKFPDANVAESLQRISGVAIDRNGGEGQFITVRGLGPEFNTVLVNGRVLATENDGREFSFDTLSSNLIQQTQVFKSSTPDLQEGGIGATVNVVTAKPLDGKAGLHLAASVGGIYDRLAKKTGPDASGILSLTNAAKTLGFLLSGSYTDRNSQDDYTTINGWLLGPQGTINGSQASIGLTPTALGTSAADLSVPRNLNFNRELVDRKRINVGASAQAKIGGTLVATLDGLYSKYDVERRNTFFAVFIQPRYIGLTTDATGTATGFNRPGKAFAANNPALFPPLFNDVDALSQNDNVIQNIDRNTSTYQIGGNLKWTPSDRLQLVLDASKTRAKRDQPGTFVVVGSEAQPAPRFDLVAGEDLPVVTNLGSITDPSLLRAHFAQKTLTKVRDEGEELHLDGQYTTVDSILKRINFGVQLSRRKKSRDDYENLSGRQCAYCGYATPIPSNLTMPFALDHYLPGASNSGTVPASFFTFDPAAIFGYLETPSVLANQVGAAEAARLLALPGGLAGLDLKPGARLGIKEEVFAGFVNTSWGGDDWSANIGARLVATDTVSSGFDSPVTSITTVGSSDFLIINRGAPTAVRIKNNYTDILPSANFKYDITQDMVLRFAVSKTVTRPTLTSLGVDNSFNGRTSAAFSSGGNPKLKPFESINYDASYEYYLNSVSYVSVSAFYKDFSNFLESSTLPITVAGQVFDDTRTRNGEKGSITGVELGGQYAFDAPGSVIDGFGVAGNFTYVRSDIQRDANSAAADCGYNGLSPKSFNASGFYERGAIQARVSYNWRSAFLRQCFAEASRPANRSAYGQLDFSAAYSVNENIQLFVQGVNLTNQYIHDYSVIDERFLRLENTGTRFVFGVRGKF